MCYPKNSVMVFLGENEGTKKEKYSFKLVKIPEEMHEMQDEEEGEAEQEEVVQMTE